MSSGDFSNLVIRRATAYNPDGSFIKDGYVFTVGANGKQSWTSDLKLNNLVLSTVTLNSQLYVASTLFDNVAASTLNVSTLSASSMNASKIVATDMVTCTLAASTLLFPSITFNYIGASSMNANTFVGNDMTVSTLRATNLSATNFTFLTLTGSTLSGNSATIQSTLSGSTVSTTNLAFTNGIGSTLTANTLTVLSTILGSSLTVSTLTAVSVTGVTIQGSTFSVNAAIIQSTLSASSLVTTNLTASIANMAIVAYSTLQGSTLTTGSAIVTSTLVGSTINAVNVTYSTMAGSTIGADTVFVRSTLTASTVLLTSGTYSTLGGNTLSANTAIIGSTLLVSTVNAVNVAYSTLVGSTLAVNTAVVQSTLIGSTVNAVNVGYSTLAGSTMTMNTGVWNSTLIGSTLNMINATYSTLQGSTLSANTVVWNSTLIGSTLNAIYVTYSTIQGSTLIANNVTVKSTLTASTLNAINVTYSTLGGSTLSANTVVIQSTLIVSSVAVSTLSASTIGITGVIAGSIGFSTLTGSSMTANTLAVGSTLTASSLNTVNMSYSTLQGGAIQSQSMIASTLTGSTINFGNLSFSTLLASTMTANVMLPLSLQGSTVNVSNLLTATNVGIGTAATTYPLTVSNTAFSTIELNRSGNATNNFYASGAVYTVTDPTGGNQFKGKYAYAFGGAKTLATTSQSQALGYYAIDVAATNGIFGSDTANGASGAMFYMDSVKTYFQNTALGVGTTSPSWPLTVAKDLSFAAMTSNPLDAAFVIKGQTNTGVLKIGTYYTGASFGAAIQSSQFSGSDTVAALILNPLGGSVGIGTATLSNTLHIYGASNPSFGMGNSTASSAFQIAVASGTGNWSSSAAVGDSVIRTTSGNLMLQTGTGAAAIYVNTSNYVGIGTANPGSLLDVNGVIRAIGTSSTNGHVDITPTSNASYTGYCAFFIGTTRYGYIGYSNSNGLNVSGDTYPVVYTGASHYFSSGSVGIGTATPATALHVNGTITATGFSGPITGNATGLTGNPNISVGKLTLAGNSTNEIYCGNVDTYNPTGNNNLIIRSWWGIGFSSYDNAVRIGLDTRTGNANFSGTVTSGGLTVGGIPIGLTTIPISTTPPTYFNWGNNAGYYKLPGGFVFQFGTWTSSDGTYVYIQFPLTFTQIYGVQALGHGQTAGLGAYSIANNGVNIRGLGGYGTAYWCAYGYIA